MQPQVFYEGAKVRASVRPCAHAFLMASNSRLSFFNCVQRDIIEDYILEVPPPRPPPLFARVAIELRHFLRFFITRVRALKGFMGDSHNSSSNCSAFYGNKSRDLAFAFISHPSSIFPFSVSLFPMFYSF